MNSLRVLFFCLFFSPFCNGQNVSVEIIVNTFNSSKRPVSNVLVSLMQGDSVLLLGNTDDAGKVKFSAVLDSKYQYKIYCEAKDYFAPESFFTPLINQTYLFDISLFKVCTLGKEDQIEFETNRTDISPAKDISWVLDLLFEYPNICLEMNYVGRENEKKNLFKKRCSYMKKYLSEHGVDLSRITFNRLESASNEYCDGCFQPSVSSVDGCK
jgi:hypothetical protein